MGLGRAQGSYLLPELIAAPADTPVWVTEGEKDTETLFDLGLVATANPGGAGKWQDDLTKYLKTGSWSMYSEDNDAPGRRHARKVSQTTD